MTIDTPERLTFDTPDDIAFTFDAPQHTRREVIPAGGPRFQVTESAYAFDAARGQFFESGHDFSTDLFASYHGDGEAGARALAFVQEQFAVSQSNVASTLPAGTTQVPYVDRRAYQMPLTTALRKGTLTDVAPFVFPRFGAASGLVQAHTEGVEPTPGAFSTTSQNVVPRAFSGKAEITREVFDQGGNPQVSNLIWNKMVQGYQEALEASVVTTLEANAANVAAITLTTAATNKALVSGLIGALTDLAYVRGGFSFDVLATQADLYRRLATAADDQGRPLLPATGVANAHGSAGRYWQSLDVNGVTATPAWALSGASDNSANSWLIDSTSVHLWSSVPQRLDWNFGSTVQAGNLTQVAFVTVGLFAYAASAISDFSGLRRIAYDPT